MTTHKVGYFIGSLSSTSINRLLAKALTNLAPPTLALSEISFRDLPLYTPDYDADYPPVARAFKQSIAEADAILFVTPEYNRSIPGALKNAIDWASRPYGKNAFARKPTAVIGASPGAIGTAISQQSLRAVLAFTAFSEYEDSSPKGKKQIRWFAPPDRGMLFFAGTCGEWWGDYGTKKEPNEGTHKLFSFLTTEANDLVRPVHAKAMPVILANQFACKEWLNAATDQIETIQARVLAAEALEIVPDDEAAQFVGGYLK